MTLEQLCADLETAQQRGDVPRRIEILRELLSLAQQHGNRPAEIEWLRWLGNAFQEKGDLQKAHSFRVTASKLADELGGSCPPEILMMVAGDLGRSFIAAHEWSNGETYTRRALALAESLHHEVCRCLYRLNLGSVLSSTGRIEEAVRLGEEVVRDAEALGDHYILGLQHLNLAANFMQQVRLNDCQRHARKALAHADLSRDASVKTAAEKLLGESYQVGRLLTGRTEYSRDAEHLLLETLERARLQGSASLECETEALLARLREQQKKKAEAADHYRWALEALERVRNTLGYEEFHLTYFRTWQSLYHRVAEFHLRQGDIGHAFQTSELSRSRLLLASIGPGRTNSSSWAVAQRAALTEALDSYGAGVVKLLCSDGVRGRSRGQTVGIRSAGDEETLDSPEISNARQSFLRLQESQRLHRALWQPQQAPAVASLEEAQQSLSSDEVILLYQISQQGFVIFALTHRSCHFQHLAYSRESLARDVEQVCLAMNDLQDAVLERLLRKWHRCRGESWPTDIAQPLSRLLHVLDKLYAILIAPVLAVAETKSHWTIVPNGPLHRLPWAALHFRDQYLIQRHSLSLLPSASLGVALTRSQPPAGQNAVFFGNPDPDDYYLQLPGSQREVSDAWAVLKAGPEPFLGPRATKTELLARAPSARLLHIASHHLFDASVPQLSFLKMAGQHGSQFLYAFEVAEMNLSTELVSLSACETARSRIATGDEQYGIVRSFLIAGARSVISTLWTIEDESAAFLFSDFYAGARSEPLAGGLAMAQRRLLDHPTYSLPYFWSPYILSGQWNRKLTV